MSSIERALSADVLVVDLLPQEAPSPKEAETRRHARTLIKGPLLRATVVTLGPGAELAEHQADGAITVQPLSGRLRFSAKGTTYDLHPGQLLSAAPGVRHAVASLEGATFLLTVAPGDAARAAASTDAPAPIERRPPPSTPEAWLRGPVDGVPDLLMPAAHALIQAREDLHRAAAELSVEELWTRPGGAASIGFHLRHIAGSLDRLLTYAGDRALSPPQLAVLAREGQPGSPPAAAAPLLEAVTQAVDDALQLLRALPGDTLLDRREVGRARLPATVLGLVFHAAEHTQRHTGQVITTAKIVRGRALGPS